MEAEKHDHKLHLTILVNGVPLEKEYPANFKVRQVMRDLLPEGEKDNVDLYQLVDRDISTTTPLDPEKSLAENGVKSGHKLSFTKKDGGGGRGSDC
jgi:hypothetical protein